MIWKSQFFYAVFGLKKCTKEMENDEKLKQLIEYISKNKLDYKSIGDNNISPKSFMSFLHNINSVERAVIALKKFPDNLSIDFAPESVAKFFNIYDPKEFSYPGSFAAELLTDDEYLRYATPEWTNSHILNYSYNKVLSIDDNNVISVNDNYLTQENEEVYESSMDINIDQLVIAKERGILKEAIGSL